MSDLNEQMAALTDLLSKVTQQNAPTQSAWQQPAAKTSALNIQGVGVPVAIQTPAGKVRCTFFLGAEHAQAKREKAALLDASPILCIACRTNTQSIIFSSMGKTNLQISWEISEHATEREMLQAFRKWANSIVNFETVIAGHNLIAFDLPKIRNAFIRNRLQLPLFLLLSLRGDIANEIIDTMKLAKAFTMEHRDDFLISLDTLAGILNIERPKQAMSRADVPAAYERGEIAPILIYCAIDTETTAQAEELMLGVAANLN